MKQVGFLALSLLLLSACGQNLEGTVYETEEKPFVGVTSFKFERNGKVYVSAMEQETELKYEVDGNKVKIIGPQGNQILTLREDDSLDGFPMGALRRKQTYAKQTYGQKVQGTYSFEAQGEQVSLTFESKGRVRLSGTGEKKEGKYEVAGNKVKIIGPEGKASFLTLHEDGSLEGPDGIRLTKKK